MLLAVPSMVVVGTLTNGDVPVVVEIHDREPVVDEDPWDRQNECEL